MLEHQSWLTWLQESTLSAAMRQWAWLYPAVETWHIISFAILFGAVAMFDLRLLGFSRHLLVTDMAGHLLPWTYISFASALLTGFLLFASDADAIAANPAFRVKLVAIALAGVNAAAFHLYYSRSIRRWNRGVRAPVGVRAIAIFSLFLWAVAIVCGRLIAYI